MRPITDEEFETQIVPAAQENWLDANRPEHRDVDVWPSLTDVNHAEMRDWAYILRAGYDDGSYEITWR